MRDFSAHMAVIDPWIEAVFGPPPSGLSLQKSIVLNYDVTSFVLLVLAVAAVSLRFYVRTRVKSNALGIDDYTIVVALVSFAL
jgi:hypothetical protein